MRVRLPRTARVRRTSSLSFSAPLEYNLAADDCHDREELVDLIFGDAHVIAVEHHEIGVLPALDGAEHLLLADEPRRGARDHAEGLGAIDSELLAPGPILACRC